MDRKGLVCLIEEAFSLHQLEYELVDVEFLKEQGRRVLRVTIDRPEGIQLADCEKVNRILDVFLDEKDPIEGPYNLEVSSPGVERPLKKKADYQRFAGREARIHMYAAFQGAKKLEGILQGLRDDEVLLQVQGEVVALPLDKISKAHLVFKFQNF
jgi:ribosome maturation factor RimP